GRRITDKNFLMLFNADDNAVDFKLPNEEYSPSWEILLDTAGSREPRPAQAGDVIVLPSKSTLILRAYSGPEEVVDSSAAASLAAMSGNDTVSTPATEREAQ
ncbi:MAG: glycogen debranching enzyme, partial [Specibacter sp.]